VQLFSHLAVLLPLHALGLALCSSPASIPLYLPADTDVQYNGSTDYKACPTATTYQQQLWNRSNNNQQQQQQQHKRYSSTTGERL
jgi:hypothetical protein